MMQSSTHTFGHQHDIISIRQTIHRHLFSDFSPFRSPVKQKNQAREDERTHHGTMDKSSLEQPIFVSESTFCIVRKNWPILQPLVGLIRQEGRQAGRQNTGGFQNFKTFNYSDFYFFNITAILLQYQNCIQSAFVKLKFILRCVLKCEKFGSHFFMSIPTIRY